MFDWSTFNQPSYTTQRFLLSLSLLIFIYCTFVLFLYVFFFVFIYRYIKISVISPKNCIRIKLLLRTRNTQVMQNTTDK
jgi:hypothetical protein